MLDKTTHHGVIIDGAIRNGVKPKSRHATGRISPWNNDTVMPSARPMTVRKLSDEEIEQYGASLVHRPTMKVVMPVVRDWADKHNVMRYGSKYAMSKGTPDSEVRKGIAVSPMHYAKGKTRAGITVQANEYVMPYEFDELVEELEKLGFPVTRYEKHEDNYGFVTITDKVAE